MFRLLLKFFGFRENNDESQCRSRATHYRRYLALLIWCISILVLYISYDLPGSMENEIMNTYKINPYEFSYFYSVYSWPSIVMCFVNGYLVDRLLGVTAGLITFFCISAVGQAIFIIGGFIDALMVMLAGRFVLGIGLESSLVAMNSSAVIWFSGKELNMVFALLMNIGRIGSSLVFLISQPTFDLYRNLYPDGRAVGYTLLTIGSTIVIPIICSILMIFLKPERKVDSYKEKVQNQTLQSKIRILDFLTFPLQFYLLVLYSSVYVAVVFTFISQSQASFTRKFNISNDTANSYVTFTSLFGFFLSPCLGLVIDKKGKNLYFVLTSILSGIIGFILITYTYVSPYLSMFFLSVSTAAFLSSVISLYSYIIPEHQATTAYGILQSGVNLFTSVGAVLMGIVANKYGFNEMEIFLMSTLIACLPLLIWVWIIDIKGTKVLNMSAVDRAVYMQNRSHNNYVCKSG